MKLIYTDKDNICLSHIQEACGSLPNEFTSVEWQAWKDMRNFLIHQYFGVDYKRVYLVIKNEIPDLLITVNQLLGVS